MITMYFQFPSRILSSFDLITELLGDYFYNKLATCIALYGQTWQPYSHLQTLQEHVQVYHLYTHVRVASKWAHLSKSVTL